MQSESGGMSRRSCVSGKFLLDLEHTEFMNVQKEVIVEVELQGKEGYLTELCVNKEIVPKKTVALKIPLTVT
ncbi:MAG: hypothetical protein K2N44_18440 [Lachnospiraceae bacterium]|nr:hypothetical protein [Lachnospiraceae bacterium]